MNHLSRTLFTRLLRLPPIFLAGLSLLISLALTGGIITASTQLFDVQLQRLVILGLIGCISAAIGYALKLPKWWIPILIVFPSALELSQSFDIPGWFYLTCFLILLIVYWNAAGERVPLFLSNTQTCAALDKLIKKDTKSFVDIGCGVGSVVMYLARRHPDIHFTGVETAPIPFLISKVRLYLSSVKNVSIRFRNMWSLDLHDFDVVYCFLSPEPMAAVYEKTVTEMRTGTLFISNSFAVPDQVPDDIVSVDDARQTELLIWHR